MSNPERTYRLTSEGKVTMETITVPGAYMRAIKALIDVLDEVSQPDFSRSKGKKFSFDSIVGFEPHEAYSRIEISGVAKRKEV